MCRIVYELVPMVIYNVPIYKLTSSFISYLTIYIKYMQYCILIYEWLCVWIIDNNKRFIGNS